MLISEFKKQIKVLKSQKGLISKQVGEAKKQDLDTSDLIQQVKSISTEIKLLEKSFKAQNDTIDIKQEVSFEIASQFITHNEENSVTGVLTVINDLPQEQWDSYVNVHPNATIYHTSAIKNVIKSTFNHQYHYLSAIDENQKVQGVVALIELNSALFGHYLVSVPFFNYGGVLASNKKARSALLYEAGNIREQIGAQHIEYRECFKFDDLPSKSSKVSMLLNLPNSEISLWDQLGTKLRAQIKKSQRNNLSHKMGKQKLVNDFYKVFAQNMRDLGTPVYTKTFFINMLQENESAHIIVIYHHNKPISAGFILGWRNTMEIPWASTLKSANKLDANMFLYWEILKFTLTEGYKLFDFGRSSKEANTYKFKKQWGAKPHELHWHYSMPKNQNLPELNPNNPKFKIMIAVWKLLPVWVANIIGPPLVKNLP